MVAKSVFIEPTAYVGWALDDDLRYHSSSGGIFSCLATLILKKWGG